MKKMKNKKGFTLLEILVALTILSVGLLGLASLQIVAVRSNSFSLQLSTATILAQQKLEEFKQTPYANIASGSDTISSQTGTGAVATLGITFNRQWTVSDNTPVADSKQVDVTVSWTGIDGKSHSVTLSSIYAKR